MPNAKEMQISRDEKIAQCLDLLKLIIDHLEIKQPESDESVVDTTLSSEDAE